MTHHITLTTPKSGQLSLIFKDAQVVANLYLHALTSQIHELSSLTECNQNVYAPDGRLVLQGATAKDLRQLPKGLYIIGRKAVVVR